MMRRGTRRRAPGARTGGGGADARRPLPRPRLDLRDLVSEAAAGVLQRPVRSMLAGLGTVLGVGTLVAILGMTATASNQIDRRFDALTATTVTVRDISNETGPPMRGGSAFPADADRRARQIDGVRAAGVFWTVGGDSGAPQVRGVPIGDRGSGRALSVMSASPGALAAAEPGFRAGRAYDAFHERRAERVVVLGPVAAEQLGVHGLRSQPAVFLDGVPFTVVGVLDDVARQAEFLHSVLVPRATAEEVFGGGGEPPSARMLVATEVGAAETVADQLAVALRPDHPEYLKVTSPPEPEKVREGVTSDLRQLFLLLGGICVVIGAVGIANTSMVAVLERTGEIGLRRALGARPWHITAQFLTESAVIGAVGSVVGTTLGLLTVLGTAIARDWTPVMPMGAALVAPVVGVLVGLAAGFYPAWRAARMPPVRALQR